MLRICHLQSPKAPFEARQTARQLADDLGDAFAVDVRTIGRGGDYPGVLRGRSALRRSAWDIVHAWDAASLFGALATGAQSTIFTLPAENTGRMIRLVRAAMAYRDIQIVCTTAMLRRLALAAGIPAELCHLIRPGVDVSLVRQPRDRDLRQALGFKESEVILAAAGESTAAAAHELAVWAMSILGVVDPAYRLLLWGRGPTVRRVQRFAHGLGNHLETCVAEQHLGRAISYEQFLAAADIVLVPARQAVDTLPIATAMAAGLPIISTATPTASELLEDGRTALMVPVPHARLIAQRVLDLRADASLQAAIGDMAHNQAGARFAQARMIEQYRELYSQVAAGGEVRLAEPAVASGM